MAELTYYEQVVLAVASRERGEECWTLDVDQKGPYVKVWRLGQQWHVHVLALSLATGEQPLGRCALHRCDNPPCFNPAHLHWGTHADNVADKVSKGRQPRGEKHGVARLTDAQVRWLKSSQEAAGLSLSQAAGRLGVSTSTVHRIRLGETWGHVS